MCYTFFMEKKFRPVLTVRIFGEEKCFGPGVAELLRRVRMRIEEDGEKDG